MSPDEETVQEETLTEQTSDEGQVDIVPQTIAEESTEDEPASAVTNDEAKKLRKENEKLRFSQEEWQKMKESSKNLEEFKTNMAKALGIEEDEVQEEDLQVQFQKKLETLEKTIQQKDWEADHPAVRNDKYKEEWNKINSDPKYEALSYDEKWKLIRDPSTTDKESHVDSVPPTSKASPSSDGEIDPDVMAMLRKANPGMTDEQIKRLSE